MCNTVLVVPFACTVLPCSLKHTALVLEEHQAALRKKLQLKQEDYQAKRCAHAPFALALGRLVVANSAFTSTKSGYVCTSIAKVICILGLSYVVPYI